MTPERWILHCDCNSFYASVELLAHPELLNTPVAVCGDPEGRHGIVLAKNEAAKKYHIQTAETIWSARSKCPNLVLLPPHREKYSHYCRVINDIYEKYSDRVEAFSIDESWLDITHTWHLFAADPIALANQIRREVQAVTGLTISVGVSFNKVFAKLGSDYKKPNATTVIRPEDVERIVWPLPVTDLLYVGRSAAQSLARMGIRTIGQLAAADPASLTGALGKLGGELSRYARGEDDAPVRFVGESDPIKSVGNGMTFRRDLAGEADIRTSLASLCDEVASRLRRHGLWAGGVQLTIRDPQFKSITRQKRLPQSSHLASELAAACLELVQANWRPVTKPIRMLTVTALSLTEEPLGIQQSFFEDAPVPDEKRERLEASLDAIRKKYGQQAVGPASTVKNQLGLAGPGAETRKATLTPDKEPENGFEEKVKGPL